MCTCQLKKKSETKTVRTESAGDSTHGDVPFKENCPSMTLWSQRGTHSSHVVFTVCGCMRLHAKHKQECWMLTHSHLNLVKYLFFFFSYTNHYFFFYLGCFHSLWKSRKELYFNWPLDMPHLFHHNLSEL